MDSEAVPKSPKRAKVSQEESEDTTMVEKNSRNTESSGTSVDSTTPDTEPEQKPDRNDEDVVIISSDDDSDKDAAKTKFEDKTTEEEGAPLSGKTLTTSQQAMETETKNDKSDSKTRTDETEQSELELSTDMKNVKTESDTADKKLLSENRPPSDSSDECISQEDLLAHLGLGSVRALANPKPKKEEKISNGVLSERRPLIPHKPKESIVDLLRAPKLKSHEEKPKVNGETPITVVNGVSDDDDSTPGTPSEADDDDELLAKEQLIEELRQELRNEEAKLLLLKKIQAAQNDPKNVSKYAKEKENEKLLSSSSQYTSLGKSGANQLSMKKSQSLPPPPPLKTHISTAGTYQPPVAIQPKLLPKTGHVQTLQGSSLSSSKSVNQLQSSKSPSRSGSSAIKDLQNVISSMSTNLIHPTPMYPRAGSQTNVYTTHAQSAPPVRPTPVRANNVPGASASSGYASFPAHISSKTSSSNPVVSSAGKQAAAKMALRKQLEKTLLQIPPPKPPPAEWSFIPSLNSSEFMTLVGFEKVVDAISVKETPKGKSPPLTEKPRQDNPKVCGQCGTDFTPCWKTKNKDGAEVLMCEKCSTVNVKKELKTEHTARLKAAFLKALKQEQEIEQKMSESTPIAPKPQSSKSSSHQSSSGTTGSRQHHHISHHQGVLHHRHQHVQPGIYHHHQQHTDSLLYQLQQQHLQQQQQEIEVARRHGDVRWHPYITQHHHSSHKPQHHHSIVSDSDRQYLLDMIPSLPAQSLSYSSSRI